MRCPSCGEYIDLDDVEAPCQLCGADLCSFCMCVCDGCGKEVCHTDMMRNTGLCYECAMKRTAINGFNETRDWKSDSKGIIGIGKILIGGAFFLKTKEDYKKARRENQESRKQQIKELSFEENDSEEEHDFDAKIDKYLREKNDTNTNYENDENDEEDDHEDVEFEEDDDEYTIELKKRINSAAAFCREAKKIAEENKMNNR